jgi:alkylation response protein AidB-like acyl-CoA dehydrogenase
LSSATTFNAGLHTPSREEILDRARALVPLLREHAAEAEAQRRPVDSVIDAIAESGLFTLSIPRRVGGLEAPFPVWFEVAAILGEGCASTAWVFIQTTQANGFIFSMNEQAQDEILASEGPLRAAGANAPTGTARRVDGGWIASGEWPYSSGIVHANWGLIGFKIENEDGSPDMVMGFAPVGDGANHVSWKDSWFVGGLRGTGSNTVVVDDVFIPEYRVLRVSELSRGVHRTPHDDELMFRSPLGTLGTMVCVAPAIGAVREALRLVVEAAPNRRLAYTTYSNQAEAPSVWVGIGTAAAKLATAEHALFASSAELWNSLAAHEQIPSAKRTEFRVVATEVMRLLVDAMQELMQAASSSSFSDANPLQRLFRDVEQASLHASLIRGTAQELHGRTLLGRA